jgi:hypothetical protein
MPICSKLAGRQIDQTFGIMDVKGELLQGLDIGERVLGLTSRMVCILASGLGPDNVASCRLQSYNKGNPSGFAAGGRSNVVPLRSTEPLRVASMLHKASLLTVTCSTNVLAY